MDLDDKVKKVEDSIKEVKEKQEKERESDVNKYKTIEIADIIVDEGNYDIKTEKKTNNTDDNNNVLFKKKGKSINNKNQTKYSATEL